MDQAYQRRRETKAHQNNVAILICLNRVWDFIKQVHRFDLWDDLVFT